MDLLEAPLREAEFLAVDTETNGKAGDECELTEVGAVLVGGGELHDRWETLVRVRAPLSRGIQRFTGITQDMVDEAPAAEAVLPELAEQLHGRVLVGHNVSFDRRVLRQAFERSGLEWPDPPALCTVALARRLAPLARQRRLTALAGALGIEVAVAHRPLADAETCARVFCALFPKLCANAGTVAGALALLRPPRRRPRDQLPARRALHLPDFSHLPDAPGVYVFRNAEGQPLYVGKSVRLRTRARSHFAPSSPTGDWTAQASIVDHRATRSELGALLLESRLIKALRPPGNVKLKHQDPYVYLRCRFDVNYPVLEVAPEPAGGHAVNVGPLRGRASAVELKEQLDSLFALRHCGRRMQRRYHASAYGQMGRCLSPCLGDLDPNLYRRRLDAALGLFTGSSDGGAALLAHVERQMREAAAEERFERAEWLRRRGARLRVLLDRLGPFLRAAHAHPRLVLAGEDGVEGVDAFWLVGGRVVDWGPVDSLADVVARTEAALAVRAEPYVPADEVQEQRIVSTWLDAHQVATLELEPRPSRAALEGFAQRSGISELAPTRRMSDSLLARQGSTIVNA
ncbi:MAG TPA: exonuclease domain-containing protein [Solirubrobacteraceae bacterium]|jgi:DNA polymerase-3 subunit epsilon|nr:exonuclease domain-containing protein [Solirubrobacteraceae bacterium]